MEDPQIRHRQMIVDVVHPLAGQLKQIGIPIKLSETPGKIPAPLHLWGSIQRKFYRNWDMMTSGLRNSGGEKLFEFLQAVG